MTHYVITLTLFCDKLCHNTSVIYVFIDNFFKKGFTANLRLKFFIYPLITSCDLALPYQLENHARVSICVQLRQFFRRYYV